MSTSKMTLEEQRRAVLQQALRDAFRREAEARYDARTLEEERENRTLKPTVIVGIGGAGCGVGARLKKALQRYYRNMPEQLGMVRFVMLDTEQLSDHSDEEVKRTFAEAGEYVYLGGFNPQYWVNQNLRYDPSLKRWWPQDATIGGTTITKGCKRLRPLGRLCLYYHRIAVEQALRNAVNQALALNEQAINDGILPPLGPDQLSVYVISGTCGGTGSGMFLDLMTMVRRVLKSLGEGGIEWSALLVMPTFYKHAGLSVSPLLREARSANGYAFLRELQHFRHYPDQWPDYVMDAERQKQVGADEEADADVPASRIYLMDNEVAGYVLTDLKDIFHIAADGLFQFLTRPVGAKQVDMDVALNNEYRGRICAFSSLGVSYIIYPRQTIARCAGTSILRSLIETELVRPITDVERQSALERAKKIFEDRAPLLDVSVVRQELQRTATSLRQQVPSASMVREEARKHAKPAKKSAMDAALERTIKAARQASQGIQKVMADRKAAAPEELEAVLKEEMAQLSGSRSVEFVREVLTQLKRLVEAKTVQISPGNGQPDVAKERAKSAGQLIERVKQLETDFIPDALQGKHFEKLIDDFAKALIGVFDAEVTAEASTQALDYRDRVLLPALNEAISRCDNAMSALQTLRNQADTVSKETDPVFDEHNVSITTQYLPRGGVNEAVRTVVEDVQNNKQLWPSFAAQLRAGAYLWRLGDPNEDVRQDVLVDLASKLPAWLCSLPEMDTVLKQSLAEVIRREMSADAFRGGPISEALKLADPTWRVNKNMVGGDLQPATFVLPGLPSEFPDEYLPQHLAGQKSSAVTLPSHRIMLLQCEEGLPIHVLGGVEDLKHSYDKWKQQRSWSTQPPHVENEWIKDPTKLEDVFPMEQSALAEYFALGLFTHWLVTEKQHDAARKIIARWTKGVIYERTPNQFYVAQLKESKGQLVVEGERQLNQEGGRAAAMQNFTQQDEGNVRLFMKKLSDAVGAETVRSLIQEYSDTVLAPKTMPDARVAENLKQQLKNELEALQPLMG